MHLHAHTTECVHMMLLYYPYDLDHCELSEKLR